LLKAVEYAADAVVITDTSGRVQYVNPAFTTLTGYSREEAVGQNTRFLKSGRQSTAFYEELWSTILSGRVWQGDVTNRRKDGTLFDEEMRIAPVKDSKGVTTGYIAIKHDVSERRAHQQALRDSLEFAQSTIDALSSHICVLDETGAIIAVNRAWMDYGEANRPEGWDKASKADEWRDCIGVGVNYLEVCRRRGGLEADEAADFADGIRAVLKGERKEYSREYSCHSPGVQRWFLGRVARFNTGNLCRIVIEHIDITERRRAEQVMLESENRFRIMADSSPIGIWVTDAQGGALFINRTYREFVGRTTEQVGPETWKSLMHPEDAPAYFKAFSEALQNKQPFKCDGRFQRADGQWRWTASYATPRFSQEGEFQGFAGITKDITERVQTVQALRSSEERFRQLAENVREVFRIVPISVDETLYVSPAYEQIWGRGMDSIYENPASWLEAVHPDDREQADLMAVHQLRGDPIEVEYRIQTPDGQKKWIRDRSFPIRDQSGELIRSIGIAEEITERKQAEILLKQTADRLVLAASAGGAGIWDLDYVKNVLHWDEQMYRLYATTKDEFSISPEACRALVHPEDRSHMEEEMYAAARGEKEFDCQFRIVWPDGSIRHIRANALVRWDASGKPLQIVGTNRDITAQKEAAAALHESNERLQLEIEHARASSVAADAANEAKSQFLANMSHEIRTPLNGVIGMVGLLLDTELSTEQRRYAEIARASGDSLLQLINDILDFSKLEAKKLDLEIVDFDLRILLENVASVLSATAKSKGIGLLCTADPAVPVQLRGSTGRLLQILTNLAGNAVKFTEVGEVVVRVTLEEEGESDCLLRFSVHDTGIGISEDKVGLLFNMFSQVDASITRKYGGTGLGLAISKQLAELMGGSIGVNSEAGKGSEFWFTARLGLSLGLPVLDKGSQLEGKTAARLDGRILVAEDNSTNRKVALGMLRKLGLRADAVADGAEAINALESIPYDLVLMDMRMPVMDGVQAARQIRNPQSAVLNHDIPIIALTANAMQSDRESCLAAGMNDFVSKPIRKTALRDALNRWLRTDEDLTQAEQINPLTTAEEIPVVFDRAGVLDRLEGDEELAQIVFAEFLEDVPKQIQALKDLVRSGDLAGSARQAHSIRGASASVGGESLRQVVMEMEKAADAGVLDGVNIRMNDLDASFLLLRDAIENYREANE